MGCITGEVVGTNGNFGAPCPAGRFWSFWEIKVFFENIFNGKLKVQIPVAKRNKTISINKYFANTILFFKILNFYFLTFSKKQEFRELFQKRFATGICDLRGIRIMYSLAPYIDEVVSDWKIWKYFFEMENFRKRWNPL